MKVQLFFRSRTLRRCVASSMLVFGSGAIAQGLSEQDLWSKLKTGTSMVVAMRHTEVQSGNSPTHFDPSGRCQGENLLTARGRDQAREIGALFARNGITPIVIYSPMCRTKETAKLAFDEQGQTHDDLREIASADQTRRQQFLKTASALLVKAAGKQVVVFIGHAPNLFELTMEQGAYGVGLVGSITVQGDIDTIGKIKLY